MLNDVISPENVAASPEQNYACSRLSLHLQLALIFYDPQLRRIDLVHKR